MNFKKETYKTKKLVYSFIFYKYILLIITQEILAKVITPSFNLS